MQRELIDLAQSWECIASSHRTDVFSRLMAKKIANMFWEEAGLSEKMICDTCGKRVNTIEDKRFLSRFGECPACDHARGDYISSVVNFNKEAEYETSIYY